MRETAPAYGRVLITGGSGGLGQALTEALTARGAQVITTDLPGRGADLDLDVTSEADWAAAVAEVRRRWGGLDVLVNNAGVAGGGRVDRAGIDEWRWITEINLFGVVRGVAAFTPLFKERQSGLIVNIASLAGLVHPAGMGSYNAVKAGVVAFTETIGHELAGHGVRAAVVCPSYFRTGLMESIQGSDADLAAVMGRLIDNAALGPDEIAAAILAGLDAGEEIIVPDEAARKALALKQTDRAAYDAMMRRQAAKLDGSATRGQ